MLSCLSGSDDTPLHAASSAFSMSLQMALQNNSNIQEFMGFQGFINIGCQYKHISGSQVQDGRSCKQHEKEKSFGL